MIRLQFLASTCDSPEEVLFVCILFLLGKMLRLWVMSAQFFVSTYAEYSFLQHCNFCRHCNTAAEKQHAELLTYELILSHAVTCYHLKSLCMSTVTVVITNRRIETSLLGVSVKRFIYA